jgi:hypothetical protein
MQKVFECKAKNAKFAATARLLLRPLSRNSALSSDYLFMDVQAHSWDSPFGDL